MKSVLSLYVAGALVALSCLAWGRAAEAQGAAAPAQGTYFILADPPKEKSGQIPQKPSSRDRTDPQQRPQTAPNAPVRESATQQGVATPNSGPTAQADVVHRLLQRKLGPEVLRRFDAMGVGIQSDPGLGAPAMVDTIFDNARQRFGSGPVSPAGTRFFQGPAYAPPVVVGGGGAVTRSAADLALQRYKSVPGGVVLEGKGAGLEWVTRVRYEPRLNAFVLADRAVYFSPIPRESAAVLATALAGDDDRVGVSLGSTELEYGHIPKTSQVAIDLKVADHFLGDIVFANNELVSSYRFANDYHPVRDSGSGNVAVFFKFKDFQFSVVDEQLQLAESSFDARIVPLLNEKAPDGGHMADLDGISQGKRYPQYERSAEHVGQNINFYRKEKIVDRAFAYGEVAAFLRALKDANIDLNSLAANIRAGLPPSAETAGVTTKQAWLDYLKDIQVHNQHENWLVATPYDSVVSKNAQNVPASFIFVDSDRRYLTSAEIQRLSLVALHIARNEIFARRGRYFKDELLRAYFSRFAWYRPFTWDVPLNPVEAANVALIRSRER